MVAMSIHPRSMRRGILDNHNKKRWNPKGDSSDELPRKQGLFPECAERPIEALRDHRYRFNLRHNQPNELQNLTD